MKFSVQKNTLTAYGVINEGDGIAFVSVFNDLEAKHNKIVIKLHTDGGSVFDGNIIFNAIQDSPADVEIHIVGIAASMGAVISLASDKVYMVENGYMMIHAPSGGTFGTVEDHQNNIKLLQAIADNFVQKLIDKTGKDEAYVSKWLKGDNWLNAKEALAEGLITGILKPVTKNIRALNPTQLGLKETYRRYSALLKPKLNTNQMELLQSLIELLELQQDATEQDVLTAVEKLAGKAKTADEDREKEAAQLIAAARAKGIITPVQVAHIENMFSHDFAGTKDYLNSLQPRVPISSLIKNTAPEAKGNDRAKADWTLEDYRKNAPKELQANPQLYKRLLEENKTVK